MGEPLHRGRGSLYDQAVALLQEQTILPRLLIADIQSLVQTDAAGHMSPIPDVEDMCAALRFKNMPVAAVGQPGSITVQQLNTAGLRSIQLQEARQRVDYSLRRMQHITLCCGLQAWLQDEMSTSLVAVRSSLGVAPSGTLFMASSTAQAKAAAEAGLVAQKSNLTIGGLRRALQAFQDHALESRGF